jgi:hypothetical protein
MGAAQMGALCIDCIAWVQAPLRSSGDDWHPADDVSHPIDAARSKSNGPNNRERDGMKAQQADVAVIGGHRRHDRLARRQAGWSARGTNRSSTGRDRLHWRQRSFARACWRYSDEFPG